MPPEHQAIFGNELAAILRGRRDELPRVAEEFYDLVFRYADIHATDVDETDAVESLDGGRVRVALYRSTDEPALEGSPYFDRTFSPEKTREVRVYMHGGDDLVIARSERRSAITIRIVGGGGADELLTSGDGSVVFYDGGEGTVTEGPGIDRVNDSPSRPFSWFEDSYDLDWGSWTSPLPGLSYDSDLGFVPIVGLQHTRFGFAKLPYVYRFGLRGGWAFSRSQPVIESSLRLRRVLAGADVSVEGLFSGIEVVNFFGFGNETSADRSASFYRVDQEQLVLTTALALGDGESWEASVGPVFKRVVSDTVTRNFLAGAQALGVGTFSQIGLRLAAEWDRRDRAAAPTEGFWVEAGAEYYAAAADQESAFGLVRGEVTGYLSPSGGNPTLAARAGGKKVLGRVSLL